LKIPGEPKTVLSIDEDLNRTPSRDSRGSAAWLAEVQRASNSDFGRCSHQNIR
jgi:hypothetical protein